MPAEPSGSQRWQKLLTEQAEQLYGEYRARDLAAQIRATAAALAGLDAYPLAAEVEPWLTPPAISPAEGGVRA